MPQLKCPNKGVENINRPLHFLLSGTEMQHKMVIIVVH